MAIAKVVFNGTTKMDTTPVTVTAADLAQGVTALGANGELITGTGGGSSDDAAKIVGRTISVFSNSKISAVGDYAFYSCLSLTDINLPNATTIEFGAFTGCTNLARASFPECTSIASSAFMSDYALSSIYAPNLISLGRGAFMRCESLELANMSKVGIIQSYAFAFCSNLSTISFPVASIVSDAAFSYCLKLASISLPEVIAIGNSAFYSCSSLQTVYLPKAYEISSAGFYYCTNLVSARFDGMRAISANAFNRCFNLLSLYLLSDTFCTLANINAFTSTPISSYTTSTGGVYGSVFVRESLYSQYISATNWVTYRSRIASMTDAQIAALDGGT